jgi:prepilin-type N-terminal cleavage/methylation domain-containing protein
MKDLMKRARERAHPVEIEGEEAVEAGFTLIELMVVLLIIAILLAIAIPTFLGVTNTANDRAAQSNLTNALTEGKALYGVNGAYASSNGTAYTSAAFTSQAPEFTWQAGACAATAANCVSFLVFDTTSTSSPDSEGLSLAVYSSKTNTCWYAFDLEASPGGVVDIPFPTAGVWYGKAATATCQALNPNSDTNIPANTFVSGAAGTNYGNAPAIS